MKVCKIKDIGIIGTGTTPSMKNKEFYDSDDIMFIKPSDFIDNRITELSSSISYISNKSREKARIFPAGTVLCTCIGNIGKIAIVSKEASCNQQNNYIIPYKEFDSKYVAYSLLSQRKKMESIGANAPIVPIINKTEFSNIEIPVYDSSTQIKIAHHLDTIQSAIDNKQQQLKELDELVKSRFIEMFGENPVESGKWKVMKLNTISDVRDGTHDSPTYCPEGYPFITTKNLIDGSIDFSTASFICKEDYELFDKRSHVDDGDILMPMIGTIGGAILVKKDREFAIKNVALIKPNEENTNLNFNFLLYVLNSDFMVNHFNRFKTGGTQKFISLGFIRELPIPVPPIFLQNQFATFVQQIDKSKFVSEQFMDSCYNMIR